VVHLARRRERPGVVPVTPDGAAAAEGAVDRPRHADDKAPDAAAERPCVIGLDDQMDMVVLNTEMKDPEAAVGGRGERAADDRKDPCGSQAADGMAAAESDMHGVRGGVCRPGLVRDARAAARGDLAARAGATAAPGARLREQQLQGAGHLVSAIIAG